MEVALVGAPGSGTRSVGMVLAERRRARFADLVAAEADLCVKDG
jgi:shikimate kinase